VTMHLKIAIIGAGNVGAMVASRVIDAGLADVVLVDIVPGMAKECGWIDVVLTGHRLIVDKHIGICPCCRVDSAGREKGTGNRCFNRRIF